MVRILDDVPGVHVTFNLVPCLLDQLEAYASGQAEDPLQRISLKPAEAPDEAERVLALRACFMGHPENLIGRFPRLVELYQRRGPGADEGELREALARFSAADLRDLQVLGKLAWFDLGWQQHDP